jgi:DNA-binding transcriptional MerR regulator/methylmalonyl-CoA mutase cobalamin-binding subunit
MRTNSKSATLGIEAVAQRSGVSQHLIRVWERRYAAVRPARTDSNRRLYSEDDALRLELLNRAVHAGHRISDIANIPTARLQQMADKDRSRYPASSRVSRGSESQYLSAAFEAIERFDAEALTTALARADVDVGQSRALDHVIMPLMERIGTMWKDGELRIAHEHMTTAVVTHHVGAILANFRYQPDAPIVVVATPVGQIHEAGALAVAAVAAASGWRPIYLGPNLPAEEIAGVAVKSGAKAVALSLVYPADDPRIPAELGRLKRLLPHNLSVLIGGRAAEAYKAAIASSEASFITDVADFRQHLEQVRVNRRKSR